MRRGIATEPGPFEKRMAEVCEMIGVEVEWRPPANGGREEVYLRDVEMMHGVDLVVAVFPEDQPMVGGTAHVVEKAQDQRVPVYAYGWDGFELSLVGEWDPDNAWSHRVPRTP